MMLASLTFLSASVVLSSVNDLCEGLFFVEGIADGRQVKGSSRAQRCREAGWWIERSVLRPYSSVLHGLDRFRLMFGDFQGPLFVRLSED